MEPSAAQTVCIAATGAMRKSSNTVPEFHTEGAPVDFLFRRGIRFQK
jgi:hypothetical protein